MRGQSYSNKKNNSNKEDFQGGETKVMKKSLKMLLVFALVFSMLTPALAFAEEAEMDAQAKFDAMVEAGILEGIDGEAALDKNMQRNEVAKILANIFELEVVAGAPTPFPDEPADNWGYTDGYIQAVVAAGLMQGGSKEDGTIGFRPNAQLSLQELAVVLNTVLDLPAGDEVEGKTSSWATAAVAAVVAAGLLPASDDFTVEATRGDLVNSTYEVYVAVEASKVPEMLEVTSFEATGAKKLAVEFNRAVEDASKLSLNVDRDGIALSIVDIEWNEAKTVATLNASYNLFAGTYTVNGSYDEEEFSAVSTEVTASKVTKISFNTQNAIITDSTPGSPANDALSARTTVKFENQYGEDLTNTITDSDISVSTSKGGSPIINKGVLTLTDIAAYTVDQKVVITVVHKATGVVGSATLTVSQSANVSLIEIGALTTDDESLGTDLYVGSDHTKYYLPLTILDQYGNELTASDLADLTILSSNDKVVNVASAVVDQNNQTVLKLEAQAVTATNGTVVITIVSTNGVSKSATLVVNQDAEIDTFTLQAPNEILKETVETEIPFFAADQYGTVLESSSDLVIDTVNTTSTKVVFMDGTQVSVTGGIISAGIDYTNDNKRTLLVTPADSKVVFTVITSTAKVQSITLNVSDAPVPVAVSGLKDTFKTAAQNGVTTTLSYSQVKLLDQYGDAVSLPNSWTVTASAVDGTFDSVTADVYTVDNTVTTSINFTANTKGSEQVKFQLKNDSSEVVDERTFTIEAVQLKDITGFGLDDVDTLYTGGTAVGINLLDYDQLITLYGLKGTTKVKVNQALIAGLTVTNGLSLNGTTLESPAIAIDTKGEENTATLTAIVNASGGAKNVSKSVAYNSAAPVATAVTLYKGTSEVTDPVVVTSVALDMTSVAVNGSAQYVFDVKDQYGVQFDDNMKYILTNVVISSGSIGIDNSTGTLSIAGTSAGDSFEVTILTSNGLTKTVKFILGI